MTDRATIIKIAIVDDKRIMRTGINEKLQQEQNMEVVFLAEDGDVFLQELKSRSAEELPHVVLMDIDMPSLNGIETVRIGKVLYPTIEFVMLTVFDEDDKIFDAIRAGATGYLLKDETAASLVRAIQEVHLYKSVPLSPVIARKALSLFSKLSESKTPAKENVASPLSDREHEILHGLIEGLDYRAIANKLFVSPYTVRNHITAIYRKLHVNNKVDAVKMAMKNGWK